LLEEQFTKEMFSHTNFYLRNENALQDMDDTQFAVLKQKLLTESEIYEGQLLADLLKQKQKDPIFVHEFGSNLEAYLQENKMRTEFTDIPSDLLEKKLHVMRELKQTLTQPKPETDSAKCLEFYFKLDKHRKILHPHRDPFGQWFMNLMEKLFKKRIRVTRGEKFSDKAQSFFNATHSPKKKDDANSVELEVRVSKSKSNN
jgi:hypothetical protein